jgi:hypothetical protein
VCMRAIRLRPPEAGTSSPAPVNTLPTHICLGHRSAPLPQAPCRPAASSPSSATEKRAERANAMMPLMMAQGASRPLAAGAPLEGGSSGGLHAARGPFPPWPRALPLHPPATRTPSSSAPASQASCHTCLRGGGARGAGRRGGAQRRAGSRLISTERGGRAAPAALGGCLARGNQFRGGCR